MTNPKMTREQALAVYFYRGYTARGMSALGRALIAGDFDLADRLIRQSQINEAAAYAQSDRRYSHAVISCHASAHGREWRW